jgi:hypothetical protein
VDTEGVMQLEATLEMRHGAIYGRIGFCTGVACRRLL